MNLTDENIEELLGLCDEYKNTRDGSYRHARAWDKIAHLAPTALPEALKELKEARFTNEVENRQAEDIIFEYRSELADLKGKVEGVRELLCDYRGSSIDIKEYNRQFPKPKE